MTELTERTTPIPTRRRAAVGLAALGWCAAVAVAATAGWLVVDRAGISLLGATGPGLAGTPVGASATATSTGVAGQPSTLSTAGGRVSAVCTPTGAISMQSAFPATDWRMEVNANGPQRLNVEFRSGSRKVEIDGVCRGGVAVLTQGHGSGGGSGGLSPTSPHPAASPSDDHGGQRGGGGSGDSGGGSGSGGSGGGSGSGGGGSGQGSG